MARLNHANVICHFSHAGVDEIADNTCHYGINVFLAHSALPENDKTQISDRDVLKLLVKQKPLEGKPGTRYAYNNTGYALLALIIEKVSKKSYADFLMSKS